MKAAIYLKNVTTLQLNPELCSGCGICLDVCPHAVLEYNHRKAAIRDRDA